MSDKNRTNLGLANVFLFYVYFLCLKLKLFCNIGIAGGLFLIEKADSHKEPAFSFYRQPTNGSEFLFIFIVIS